MRQITTRRGRLALLTVAALAVGAVAASPIAAQAAITRPAPGVVGNFESATATTNGKVTVQGWASVDFTDYNRVAVYSDGERVANVLTGTYREDVSRYLGTFPQARFFGFTAAFTVKPGKHVIRAYVLTPDGSNPLFGTKTITTTSAAPTPSTPLSTVDSVSAICPAPGTTAPRVKIVGWEFDPDLDGGPGLVDVYTVQKDGSTTAVRRTNQVNRPDVKKAYNLTTDKTGFSIIASAAQLKTVRLYAINQAGAGSNPLMTTIDYASLANPSC